MDGRSTDDHLLCSYVIKPNLHQFEGLKKKKPVTFGTLSTHRKSAYLGLNQNSSE